MRLAEDAEAIGVELGAATEHVAVKPPRPAEPVTGRLEARSAAMAMYLRNLCCRISLANWQNAPSSPDLVALEAKQLSLR